MATAKKLRLISIATRDDGGMLLGFSRPLNHLESLGMIKLLDGMVTSVLEDMSLVKATVTATADEGERRGKAQLQPQCPHGTRLTEKCFDCEREHSAATA